MLFSRGARSARTPSSICGGAPCVEVVVREVWRRALAATLLARRPPRRALLHSSTRASGQNEHLSVLRGLVSSAAGNVGLTTAMCSRDRPPPGAPDGRDNGLISGASRPEGRRHLPGGAWPHGGRNGRVAIVVPSEPALLASTTRTCRLRGSFVST